MTEAAMTGKEARLAVFFAADEPPARDVAFVARISDRIERRPLWEMVCDGLMVAAGFVALVWALFPALVMIGTSIADMFGEATPFLVAGAIIGGTFWAAMRFELFAPVLEGEPA